jgi:hypothetical protein
VTVIADRFEVDRGNGMTDTRYGIYDDEARPGVILFGAGASFACDAVLPSRPPLGAELYAQLREQCPTWAAIRIDLDEGFERLDEAGIRCDFERGMANVQKKLPMEFWTLLREMAVFFTQFTADGTGRDAYSRLIGSVRSAGMLEGVLFSTLNYERICETAAAGLGLSVNYARHPVEDGDAIWLHKLHGSCDFMPPEDKEAGAPDVTSAGDLLRRLQVMSRMEHPLMTLYTPEKGIVGKHPSWLLAMIRDWTKVVATCRQICVVGVAPPVPSIPDADSHVWRPIRETTASVSYVGLEADFLRLQSIRGASPCEHLGVSFAECVDAVAMRMSAAGVSE